MSTRRASPSSVFLAVRQCNHTDVDDCDSMPPAAITTNWLRCRTRPNKRCPPGKQTGSTLNLEGRRGSHHVLQADLLAIMCGARLTHLH